MIDPNLPINKLAALVVNNTTTLTREFNSGATISSLVPLPTRMWFGRPQDDLTGKKFGSFIVIGCALWLPNNHRTSTNSVRWVCRCKCGRYQMFTTKIVKKPSSSLCCVECRRN